MTRSHSRLLAALLAFAFALRVLFLLLADIHAPLTGDELAYQQIAEHVAAGRGLFQTNNPFFPGQALYAWQAPLYPFTLGALYALLGNQIFFAKLFGVLVGTATVYVVYDAARRVFRAATDETRAERIALGAGLIVAVYPGFLTLAHLLLSEGLFILFLMGAFDCLARALEGTGGRRWAWLVAGALAWGLATLTRGLTLYFTPLLALWLGATLWRETKADAPNARADGASKRLLLKAILPALGLMLITLAVIAPYTARNYFQFHQFVLLETKGGVNLWLGNSPYTPYEFIRNVWKVGVREPMLKVLPQDEIARDRAAYALALEYMRAHPLAVLARVPAKFADFWGFERNLVDVAEATRAGGGWNSVAKIMMDLYGAAAYMIIALGGMAGLIYAPRDRWKILFGGFILYFLALHLLIFGDGRFHLPLIPFLALYAAWLAAERQRVAYVRTRTGLVVVGAALLLATWTREAWAAWQMLGH